MLLCCRNSSITHFKRAHLSVACSLPPCCRNSNIVQFQGVVIRKDSIWLVQELCESDLYTAIGNGKVSWYKR